MRAGAQSFMRQQLSALPTSDSAAGWRPDKVQFLFRLFYFSGLLAAPTQSTKNMKLILSDFS